jgi:hypothetical protein
MARFELQVMQPLADFVQPNRLKPLALIVRAKRENRLLRRKQPQRDEHDAFSPALNLRKTPNANDTLGN